uniref:Pollen-specific protein C13 n=1 Tax=Rhizophora mucronata TaxID=61149 RepID=A0A2P2IP77_RHIMU
MDDALNNHQIAIHLNCNSTILDMKSEIARNVKITDQTFQSKFNGISLHISVLMKFSKTVLFSRHERNQTNVNFGTHLGINCTRIKTYFTFWWGRGEGDV